MRSRAAVVRAFVLCATLPAAARAQWRTQESGSTASLRGVSAVDAQVVWASGSNGTVLLTTDGGRQWRRVPPPPGSDSLDFRDVQGVSATTAFVMSAGPSAQSRIYKTTSAGREWTLQHRGADSSFFLDAVAFWDARHGVAMSDPVGGRFAVLTTSDGGASWRRVPPSRRPPAVEGEAGFAAGGAALAVQGAGAAGHAWFGTGGRAARVFHSSDRGQSWQVAAVPLASGAPSQGVFALAFADARHGVAVGGDYAADTSRAATVALTRDGGRSWARPTGTPPGGYRSGLALVPGTGGRTFVAVGTSGSDRSTDGGESWQPLDATSFNAVSFASPTAGWAVGGKGRIARYEAR
jgi:photosystem II stability/assembly factor-like uncharacterized protein